MRAGLGCWALCFSQTPGEQVLSTPAGQEHVESPVGMVVGGWSSSTPTVDSAAREGTVAWREDLVLTYRWELGLFQTPLPEGRPQSKTGPHLGWEHMGLEVTWVAVSHMVNPMLSHLWPQECH
jgi:hypothetical protein